MQSIGTFLAFVFFFYASTGFIEAKAPFLPGEKLIYSLKWGFLPVGSATMEVLPRKLVNGELCHVFRFNVQTNSFADAFYKVRTSIESIVDKDFNKTLFYQKNQSEGSTRRDIKVEFDYQEMKCYYYRSDEKQSEVSIPEKVFDPLAIAYLFRFNQLRPNFKKALPTCDGRRYKEIVVKTGKRERISVPAGKFWAYGTVPEMQNLSGVFKKSPDGILCVWYSDDSMRIPVKISSKVVVGSFTATLVEAFGLVR